MNRRWLGMAVVVAIWTSGCGQTDSTPLHIDETAGRSTVIGREFVSIAVADDSGHSPFAEEGASPARVSFGKSRHHDWMSWGVCNGTGRNAEITPGHISVEGPGNFQTTLIDCSGPLNEQDAWLAELFATDLEWGFTDGELVLTTNDRGIRLKPAEPR